MTMLILKGLTRGHSWWTTVFYTRTNLLWYLYIKEKDICNIVDDTTLHDCRTYLDTIKNKLRINTYADIKWIKNSDKNLANRLNLK